MTLLTLENTAIVADSTADPPAGYFDREGLCMVPLRVHFGDDEYLDGFDLGPEQFFAKLESSSTLPTTSQPPVSDFVECYGRLRERYEHVLSVHIAPQLSGTLGSAKAAAAQLDGVEVFDSGTTTTAITLLVDRLRAKLAQGIALDDAHAYIRRFYEQGRLLIHAATLEYLRRGGRIGKAQSLVGGLLGIQPFVEIWRGDILPYAKVRGTKRILPTFQGYLERYSAPGDEIHIGLTHAANPDAIGPLTEALLNARPKAHIDVVGAVAAVVGTHIGPGASAFAMIVE